MTETELSNQILVLLYKDSKESSGNPSIKTISGLNSMIPGVSLGRVHDACRLLKDLGYIKAILYTNGDGVVQGITIEGRQFVEENYLIPEKSSTDPKDKPEGSNNAGAQTTNTTPGRLFYAQENTSALKDRNISPCFGVENQADCFINLLDSVAEKTASNFCMVGIFAQWGRGKTYLFNIIKEKLEERNKKNKNINYDVVEFNAWKYQQTPAIWAYLYESLYDHKCFCFHWGFFIIHNFKRFLLALLAILSPFILNYCIELLCEVLRESNIYIANYQQKNGYVLSFILSVIILALTAIKSKPLETIETIKKMLHKNDFSNHLGVQAEIEKELIALINFWIDEDDTKDHKILLYVDDIDRCDPKKMLDIIDSLRLILENEDIRKRVVVVCSIDAEKLKKGLIAALGDEKLAIEQMDKIFIAGMALSNLSNNQINKYIDKLPNNKSTKETVETSNISIDTSREQGSLIVTSSSDDPKPITDGDIANMLKECLSELKVTITPRRARILYYRLILANNYLSQIKGGLFSKELAMKIVRKSLGQDIQIHDDEALSDLIQTVVPY